MIYLDHNATTALSDEAREAMLPFLHENFQNPSSAYQSARSSSVAITTAREEVARLLDCDPRRLVFTSGGTESNNTALHAALATQPDRRQVITTWVEHPSVYNYCRHLENSGHPVTYLAVDHNGNLDLETLEGAITGETAIVSLMAANNETGVLSPVADAVRLSAAKGVMVHTDSVQAIGKVPISAETLGVDYLSVSAHKLNGPKGIGALYIADDARYVPYMFGGEQELDRRPGTENVAAIVGFGVAARRAREDLDESASRTTRLRNSFEQALLASVRDVKVCGEAAPRLPNTSLLLIRGADSETVLTLLDMQGICCSSGSACSTGSPEPSRVLMAMGLTRDESRTALRFSLGRSTTEQDIEDTVVAVRKIVTEVRART